MWPWAAGYTADLWSAFVCQYPKMVTWLLSIRSLAQPVLLHTWGSSIPDADLFTFSLLNFMMFYQPISLSHQHPSEYPPIY